MKRILLGIISTLLFTIAQSQRDSSYHKDERWKKVYRSTPEKVFDLIHTKIDVRFDYEKKQMPGKVWLTLKPHFYDQDSLILDAKGMLINKVSVMKGNSMQDLTFTYYDTLNLRIKLDKIYKRDEQLVIYIDYVARPDIMAFKASAAIVSAKGLYFINADGKDATKPTQIWTQGETESNSVWVPIIDKPNQKTTDEIIMTVPAKYQTLSNGLLINSTINKDDTRTDYWKMDLPHSPYLFFMGVGNFAIVKDKYKDIAVDYYVEPKYADVARQIFGLTPEMIGFFSKLLGVEYPWPKYAQMVGYDYVSGAMENTSATLHGTWAYQNKRSLLDGNTWEYVVAHELFHQWFGDYVTNESWSNVTLNESFANYSQTLWKEYKYGKDVGDEENYQGMQGYIYDTTSIDKNLVRFYYDERESVFDRVSYLKGGRILHMLRNYLGDSAFFKGLNLYLTTNKFKSAEAHQLRLAMEEVSGKDLNWFFNQWYYGSGHPKVDINYEWDEATKQQKVTITQQQKNQIFQFPLTIDIYNGSKKTRNNIWVKDTVSAFTFFTESQPNLVNVDGDKIMLWEKDDHKTATQYVHQFNHSTLFIDRKESLDYIFDNFDSSVIERQVMINGLMDRYYGIRDIALSFWKKNAAIMTADEEKLIYNIAQRDEHLPTRGLAIDVLAKRNGKLYESFFKEHTKDSSYSIAGAALEALLSVNANAAIAMEKQLNKDAEGRLRSSISIINYIKRNISEVDSVIAEYKRMGPMEKLENTKGICQYAIKIADTEKYKKLLSLVIENCKRFQGRSRYPILIMGAREAINELCEKKKNLLNNNPNNIDLKEQVNYMKEKLPEIFK